MTAPLPTGRDAMPSVHSIGGQTILFDRDRQTFLKTNEMAALIWQGLGVPLRPKEVADALSTRCGITSALARDFVAQALNQWRGLRKPPKDQTAPEGVQPAPNAAPCGTRPTSNDPGPRHDDLSETAVTYTVLDTRFHVRFCKSTPYEDAHRLLHHLSNGLEQARCDRRIDVVRGNTGFACVENGTIRQSCTRRSDIAAMLKATLCERALLGCDGIGALHAAAIRRDDRCVLLIGDSGAGKSSLCAALGRHGYEILGDDTIVVDNDVAHVRAVPFAPCVKAAGARLLAPYYKSLDEGRIHTRPDGRNVHYLVPPEVPLAPAGRRASPHVLLFPEVVTGMPAELTPLDPMAAFDRLLRSFVPLGGPLSRSRVEGLIAFVSGMTCYTLRTPSLESAVEAALNADEQARHRPPRAERAEIGAA